MWTKQQTGYHSFLMLVRIGFESGFTIPIPIPLFLLDQTLDAVEDLAWLAEKLFLRWAVPTPDRDCNSPHHTRNWTNFAGAPTKALRLCREIIRELRRYGKWRMVEVEARDPKHHGRVRVYVDFI
jgi:hypothetical protein